MTGVVAAQGLLLTVFCLLEGPAAGPDSSAPDTYAGLANPVGVLTPAFAPYVDGLDLLVLQLPLLLAPAAFAHQPRMADGDERPRLVALLLGDRGVRHRAGGRSPGLAVRGRPDGRGRQCRAGGGRDRQRAAATLDPVGGAPFARLRRADHDHRRLLPGRRGAGPVGWVQPAAVRPGGHRRRRGARPAPGPGPAAAPGRPTPVRRPERPVPRRAPDGGQHPVDAHAAARSGPGGCCHGRVPARGVGGGRDRRPDRDPGASRSGVQDRRVPPGEPRGADRGAAGRRRRRSGLAGRGHPAAGDAGRPGRPRRPPRDHADPSRRAGTGSCRAREERRRTGGTCPTGSHDRLPAGQLGAVRSLVGTEPGGPPRPASSRRRSARPWRRSGGWPATCDRRLWTSWG